MDIITCPKCSREINNSANVCPDCGYVFEENTEQLFENRTGNEDNIKTKKSKTTKKIVISIIAVIILILFAIGVFFLVTVNSRTYKKAIELYNTENYSEALENFNKINDYNDSADYIKKCEYELSVNGQFLKALATGLEERWKLTDAEKETETTEDWENYINAEYTMISKFANMNFEDQNLADLAKNYIKMLESAQDIVKYYGSNESTFWREYNPIYQERAIILMKINNDYVIPVSDDKKVKLNDIVTSGELVLKLQEILSNAKFQKISEEYGWKEYEAVVENTSNTAFSWFIFNINLIDKNGTIVETPTASTSNWGIGNKHKFKFSTNENFEKIVVYSCNYS